MKYFVYLLKCKDDSIYTGLTWNLQKRLESHSKGASKYTRSRLPVELVYFEEVSDKIAAAKREYEIKSWVRSKKLELINSRSNQIDK